MTPAEQAAPFERLARMIEHELELAGQGRLDELEAAVDARGRYLRTLPAPAPPAARSAIVRAEALHRRVVIETTRLRESIGLRRANLRRSRRVAKGYAGPIRARVSLRA